MSAVVKALPIYKLTDIPEALRQLANRIDAGELEKPERIVIAIEHSNGSLDYKAFGKEPFSKAYAIGICHGAIDEILHG